MGQTGIWGRSAGLISPRSHSSVTRAPSRSHTEPPTFHAQKNVRRNGRNTPEERTFRVNVYREELRSYLEVADEREVKERNKRR